ncbi:hypothetical protein ACXR0O_25465 [Verrucomicrobiota bacterium sgz303538]
MATLLVACSKKHVVGDGYSLVTPESLNPDSHPGTTLRRNGKIVWGNVYIGYFHNQTPPHFFHNGVFVFVGPLPIENSPSSGPQLFAVRGDGPPVFLTERLHGQRLIIPKRLTDESNRFEVTSIASIDGGIQAEIEYWKNHNTKARRTIHVTWAAIETLLDEATTSGELMHAQFDSYYALHL